MSMFVSAPMRLKDNIIQISMTRTNGPTTRTRRTRLEIGWNLQWYGHIILL